MANRDARSGLRTSRVVREAARMLRDLEQTDDRAALAKAARRVHRRRVGRRELPDPRELRSELDRLAHADEARDLLPPPLAAAGEDDGEDAHCTAAADDARFATYRQLLSDLADVHQGRARHPEGDCLTHSLQVYVFAQGHTSWDEEFLLAALLHDVGKAAHYRDPVPATLELLDGLITDRTRWLIEHQSEGRRWVGGVLSPRALRRLSAHPDGEDLKALARCDRAGTRRAMRVPRLDEALAEVRALSEWAGSWDDNFEGGGDAAGW